MIGGDGSTNITSVPEGSLASHAILSDGEAFVKFAADVAGQRFTSEDNQKRDEHWTRNKNQDNRFKKVEDLPKKWFENWGGTGTHNIGTSGNQDWRGTKPDQCVGGRCLKRIENPYRGWQLIYNSSGNLVTDIVNQGTFDLAPPGTIDHIKQDVTPWVEWGNGPNDPTTREQRIKALPEAIQWLY